MLDAGVATAAGWTAGRSGVAAAGGFSARPAAVITAIAPKGPRSGKYRSTLATGLAVIVATCVARVAAVRRVVDPRINVELAAAVALTAATARVAQRNWAATIRGTSHGANAATRHPGDGQAESEC